MSLQTILVAEEHIAELKFLLELNIEKSEVYSAGTQQQQQQQQQKQRRNHIVTYSSDDRRVLG
jgi:hypothetical protein